MKTSSKTLDGPEAKPQQITGHDLTDNNASEKAGSHFPKEHHNSEISSNQIFNLKKKLTLLITLAIALAAFLMTACEDDPEFCSNCSYWFILLLLRILLLLPIRLQFVPFIHPLEHPGPQ